MYTDSVRQVMVELIHLPQDMVQQEGFCDETSGVIESRDLLIRQIMKRPCSMEWRILQSSLCRVVSTYEWDTRDGPLSN